MLILNRYVGEKIMVGDNITVEVVDEYPYRGTTQVRIGVLFDGFERYQIVAPVCVSECLNIGDNISVKIIDAYPYKNRTQVCLGIQAPREVTVHRLEIYEKVRNGEKLNEPQQISDR